MNRIQIKGARPRRIHHVDGHIPDMTDIQLRGVLSHAKQMIACLQEAGVEILGLAGCTDDLQPVIVVRPSPAAARLEEGRLRSAVLIRNRRCCVVAVCLEWRGCLLKWTQAGTGGGTWH